MKVFGIAGYSGSGKTTLIEKLLPELIARGLRVSVIKHTHHDADIDQPGKDSYRHRAAGAHEVLLAGGARWALLHELRDQPAPSLQDHLLRLAPCDLVLVEGFKQEAMPKIEVYRQVLGKPALFPNDSGVIAIASDAPVQSDLLCLSLDDVAGIVDCIVVNLGLIHDAPGSGR